MAVPGAAVTFSLLIGSIVPLNGRTTFVVAGTASEAAVKSNVFLGEAYSHSTRNILVAFFQLDLKILGCIFCFYNFLIFYVLKCPVLCECQPQEECFFSGGSCH